MCNNVTITEMQIKFKLFLCSRKCLVPFIIFRTVIFLPFSAFAERRKED